MVDPLPSFYSRRHAHLSFVFVLRVVAEMKTSRMLTVNRHRVCADKPLTVCSFCLRESPPLLWCPIHRPALRPFSSGARCPCPARAATPADRSRTLEFFSLSHLLTLSPSHTHTRHLWNCTHNSSGRRARAEEWMQAYFPSLLSSFSICHCQ